MLTYFHNACNHSWQIRSDITKPNMTKLIIFDVVPRIMQRLLQWHHMGVMDSKAIGTLLFVQQIFGLTTEKTSKLWIKGHLWGEPLITGGLPRKGSIMTQEVSMSLFRHDHEALI